ncbi:hypothetical protein KQI65_02995 [bacterium]|nr:hypothetical protein [bacterium]
MSKDSSGQVKTRRSGFPRRKYFAVGAVLLFLAVCVLLYFRSLERNREHLTQHNIRHLGTIATVIQERLDAFADAVGNALDYSADDRWKAAQQPCEPDRRYTRNAEANPPRPQGVSVRQEYEKLPAHLRGRMITEQKMKSPQADVVAQSNREVKEEKPDNAEEVQRVAQQKRKLMFSDSASVIEATPSYDQLLDVAQITEGSFDAILLVSAAGDSVLFNSAPQTMRITRIDSVLIDEQNRSFLEVAMNTNVGLLTVANKEFLIYIQVMKDLRVCGMLERDRFEKQVQSIHGVSLLDGMIVLALLLLAIPLITLHYARINERIQPLNVLITIACIILGSTLVVLLLADFLYNKQTVDEVDNRTLEHFSREIKQRVTREFAQLDSMTTMLDRDIAARSGVPFDSVHALTDSAIGSRLMGHLDSLPFHLRPAIFHQPSQRAFDRILSRYPYFHQLYWMDEEGLMKALWTKNPYLYYDVPVKDREYFQAVMNGAQRYIQPHYTRSSGDFMVAYSRPSPLFFREGAMRVKAAASDDDSGACWDTLHTAVGAVDLLPRSLVNTWFPEGYGFMFIDRAGFVLFHSITRRSLHENLFDECGDNALRDIVEAGADGLVSTRYWEDQVRMLASPFSLPHVKDSWYLVVYSEQDMITDMKAGNLMMSGMMYLYFFIPIMLGFIFFAYMWDPRLRLLWHKPGFEKQYKERTLSSLIAAAVTMFAAMFLFDDVYLVLLTGLVLPHAHYQLTLWNMDANAIPYPTHHRRRWLHAMRSRRGAAFIVHAIMVLLYLYILFVNMDADADAAVGWTAWGRLLVLAALVLLLILIDRGVHLFVQRRGSRGKNDESLKWYVRSLTATVLLVSFVPMAIFFRGATDLHSMAYERVQKDSFFRSLTVRNARLEAEYESERILHEDASRLSNASVKQEEGPALYDTLAMTAKRDTRDVYIIGKKEGLQASSSVPVVVNDTLLRAFLLPVNSSARLFRRQLASGGAGSIDTTAVVDAGFRADNLPPLVYPRSFRVTPRFGGVLPVILAFGIFLLILYTLIRYGTRRLFMTEMRVPDRLPGRWEDGSCLFIWTSEEDHRRFLDRCRSMSPEPEIHCLNEHSMKALLEDNEHRPGDDRRVVLDCFEYDANNAIANLRKLELLEHLLFTQSARVCVVCSVDPEYYFFQSDDSPQSPDLRERWKRVLNMLVTLEYGNSTEEHVRTPHRQPLGTHPSLAEIVDMDCTLAGMEDIAEHAHRLVRDGLLKERDDVLLWISKQSKPLYQSIWMTCRKRERFVLYRIAQDGFVPHRALNIIRQLVTRGLLIRDPSLCVFNETFERFILEVKTPEQIREWEAEEPPGIWGSIKHPILVGFVVIAAALFYVNPNYFDSTVAILTALAGAIPLLFRVRGFITTGKAE